MGLIRGMRTFDIDMKRKFNTPKTALSSGNRDVPVKGTRTIYPIQLSVPCANYACTSHLIPYGVSSKGTYSPRDPDFAASISSGFDESIGSRVIDDIDLIMFSGSPKLFVLGVDYGEYDSHCTWENIREPIIRALKDMHKDDAEKFGGYSRVDLVDFAHGDGRMHNTLWNVGRRVVRAKSADIEKYALTNIH